MARTNPAGRPTAFSNDRPDATFALSLAITVGGIEKVYGAVEDMPDCLHCSLEINLLAKRPGACSLWPSRLCTAGSPSTTCNPVVDGEGLRSRKRCALAAGGGSVTNGSRARRHCGQPRPQTISRSSLGCAPAS